MVSLPARYRVEIGHTRFVPFERSFRHAGSYWLVDVDRLPVPPAPWRWFARFESRDHFTDPSRSIRENAVALLAEHGVRLDGGRILMLACPRGLGHVFNPLSIFWCYGDDDGLRAVIAEVHNTYGQRHAYVLTTDPAGRADVAKDFYVSPFLEVDGEYRILAPEPDDRLRVSITLHQEGRRVFTAWMTGEQERHRSGAKLRWLGLLEHPLGTRRVAALIRRHGVALWLRGLPVVPRTQDRSNDDRVGASR